MYDLGERDLLTEIVYKIILVMFYHFMSQYSKNCNFKASKYLFEEFMIF